MPTHRRFGRCLGGGYPHRSVVGLVASLFGLAVAVPVYGVGFQMFSTVAFSTGEKPQSKLWYHDGSYWGILQGPTGVAFYEKVGSTWQRGQFAAAVLATSGQADVKWNGTNLFVLNYASTCQVFKYTYDTADRAWLLVSGFPVTVPNPSGSETMVLEQDGSGRLWTAARGGTSINVYYSTSADHRTWNPTPFVVRTGVNADDICSIVAFGGNKVGVFWSDQNRWEFGFRVHQDADSPTTWGATEVVYPGTNLSDDHINLAFDSQGRVYAITKDAQDNMAVHRRAAAGGWTTKTNVLGGTGTRGIIMVAESDAKVYILYTRWGITPETIEYRVADINTLTFGGQTTFISSSANMNNVTGMKQILPPGSLVAVAENGSQCWYNSFGSPPSAPPGPPTGVTATLLAGPAQVQVAWSPPSGVTPDGYDVYRQQDGGSFAKLNAALVSGTSYTDTNPPLALLCYQVRAVDNGVVGNPSASACADNSPLPPPGPPLALTASLEEVLDLPGVLSLSFDEGSGQTSNDASGLGNHARLGSAVGSDTNDPTWTPGVAGTALQFDGSNDYIQVADSPSLDMAGSYTVEGWVRHDGGTGTFVNKGLSGSRTYRVLVTSSGDVEFRWENSDGDAQEASAADAIPDAAWHHVACVYDQVAGQNRIYVDGDLLESADATGTPAANNQVLSIGARLSSSYRDFLDGAVDDVRITPGVVYVQGFVPPVRFVSSGANRAKASPGAPPAPAARRMHLVWEAPQGGAPVASYNVYRAVDGAAFVQLNAGAVSSPTFDDTNPVVGSLCYRVTALNSQSLEGVPSTAACVTVLPLPPGAPEGLTASLVALAPGPPAGAAAYSFDEAAGPSFADATGHGHSGQLGSGPGFDFQDPHWSGGVFGSCLRFDGIDDHARVADAAELRFDSSFTLEAWLVPGVSAATRCVLAKGKSPALEYAMLLDEVGHVTLRWEDANGVAHDATTSVALDTTTWQHVACVHDQTTGENRIYIDGVLVTTSPDSGVPAAGQAVLYLGAQAGASGPIHAYHGSMDLVRVSSGARYGSDFAPPYTYMTSEPLQVDLTWQVPGSGAPVGYNVYRQQNGEDFLLLNPSPIVGLAFHDATAPAAALCYRVTAVDTWAQESTASGTECVQTIVTDAPPTDEPAGGLRPFGVHVFPNPARSEAAVALRLPAAVGVRLDVFNLRGERVARVCDTHLAAGGHTLRWNGRTTAGLPAAAGVYWLVVDAGGNRTRTKLVLLR